MKHLINTLFIVAVMAIVSVAVSAQVKVITEREYDAAINAAKSKTGGTYPRIVTATYKSGSGDEDVSVNHYESARRYRLTNKNTSEGNVSYLHTVMFDGLTFDRENGGVWESQGPIMTIDRYQDIFSTAKFTVEKVTTAGKIFKMYTKVAKEDDGTEIVFKNKIDALGRLVESSRIASDTNTTTYEYPKTLPRIKKPRLGSKEDI